MWDQEEDIQTKEILLTVNVGQSVTLLQGIVQKEPVLEFVMGAHARVGRDSPVLLLDHFPELLSLICSFAGIYITTDSEYSERCFNSLFTEIRHLTNTRRRGFWIVFSWKSKSRTSPMQYLSRGPSRRFCEVDIILEELNFILSIVY